MRLNQKERNDLVLKYQHIVTSIANSYAKIAKIEVQDLESYGYEGLVLAMNNFDFETQKNFSQYAGRYIQGYILKGIAYINGYSHFDLYYAYIKAKKNVEQETEESIQKNISLLDTIIDEMIQNNNISKNYKNHMKNRILLNSINSVPVADIDAIQTDNSLFYQATLSIQHQGILNVLDTLDKREKEIIIARYGLFEAPIQTLQELALQFGVKHQTIAKIEKKALCKLRHPSRLKKIKFVYDIINEYQENNDLSLYQHYTYEKKKEK